MTTLDPKPIIKRLEEIGKEGVKKKLAEGVFADYKKPLIKKWLRGEYVDPVEDVTQVVTEEAVRVGDPDNPVTGPELVDVTEEMVEVTDEAAEQLEKEPIIELTDEVTVEEVPVVESDEPAESISDDQLDDALAAAENGTEDPAK